MSEKETKNANDKTEQAAAKPSHLAYSVREGSGGAKYFNRVGAAFAHKDGQGFNLDLEATPVNGRVVLRTPWERLDQAKDGKKASERDKDGPDKGGHEE